MDFSQEQEKIRNLLANAVPLLCKNGLSFSAEISVEALIGITLDKNNVFLVNIKETIAPQAKLDVTTSVGNETEDVMSQLHGKVQTTLKRPYCEVNCNDIGSHAGGYLDNVLSTFFTPIMLYSSMSVIIRTEMNINIVLHLFVAAADGIKRACREDLSSNNSVTMDNGVVKLEKPMQDVIHGSKLDSKGVTAVGCNGLEKPSSQQMCPQPLPFPVNFLSNGHIASNILGTNTLGAHAIPAVERSQVRTCALRFRFVFKHMSINIIAKS